MSPRTAGSLNATMLTRIRECLANGGDTSIIPPKALENYYKFYADKTPDSQEIQDAIEMTFTPEEPAPNRNAGRNPPQHANPLDDVIPNEEDDRTPPWEEDEKTKVEPNSFVPDPTLGVSEDFGEQPDENHEDAFLAAIDETVAASATPMTTSAFIPEPTAKSTAKKTPSPKEPIPSAEPAPIPPIRVGGLRVADTIKVNSSESAPIDKAVIAKYGERGWTDYILGQLVPGAEKITDKEKQIRPKCMGLRRMVEQCIGVILSTEMEVVAQPSRDNLGIWAIKATVKVQVTNPDHPAHNHLVAWSDIANSFAQMDGQSDIVTLNPVASAYTAALSRCFRSILGLSGVYASEEMEKKGSPLPSHNPDNKPAMQELTGPITDKQIKMIETGCNRYKANVIAVARDVCQDVRINALTELTAQEGFKVASAVNNFQSSPVPTNWKL